MSEVMKKGQHNFIGQFKKNYDVSVIKLVTLYNESLQKTSFWYDIIFFA